MAWARELLAGEIAAGGSWSETIDLDAGRYKLGQGYEVGNVIARGYALDAVPSDVELEADLRAAVSWLAKIYQAVDEGLYVPGEPGPEVSDAELAIEQSAGKRRRGGQGFRLTAPEKKAIEDRAVEFTMARLLSDGYSVKDVGSRESYDIDARKGETRQKVEVKGTTSPGESVILTRNEVLLHLEKFPDNALAIVHSIELHRESTSPTASGGVLVYEQPWVLVEDRLTPMAYRYDTGLGAQPSVTAPPALEDFDAQL